MVSLDLMIELSHVSKSFPQGDGTIEVLRDVSLSVGVGEVVALIGPSGSGKSTLLSLMSGMDVPSSGSVRVDGKELSRMDDGSLSSFRNSIIGIVFQTFELIPSFTALENVLLPSDLSGTSADTNRKRAEELLVRVGLAHRLHQLPGKLSGGESQRVAIARALMNAPRVIFADEPTGNLDQANGGAIMDLLVENVRNEHGTLILITHDPEIAKRADRIFSIKDGAVTFVR